MKTMKRSNLSLSKLQSPVTTQWLHNNYELQEGMTLPRSSLYTHYLDFCTKNSIVPVNAASFGKIIRITFPDLKTRRLGTRGQSKYHYYGIGIKITSAYYDIISNSARQSTTGFGQSSGKGEPEDKKEYSKTAPVRIPVEEITIVKDEIVRNNINNQNDDINNNNKNNTVTSTATNNNSNNSGNIAPSGTLLPEFPTVDTITLDDAFLKDKVKTFLIMYRAHCQRILDTILRANFAEVKNFLIHFWQGMPAHIIVILSEESVIELIATCDNILYKAVTSVLIPGSMQPLPASLTQAIQQFAKQITTWLEIALYHLPEELQNKKLSVAKSFSQLLCRQTSLSHLAQAARTVLHNSEPSAQMNIDLNDINFTYIIKQVLWISPQHKVRDMKLAEKFYQEFTGLLEKQSSIEEYTEWIASLVTRCVVKPSEKEEGLFQGFAQEFLLKWSFITSKVIQELTLRSAKSFGSFHLLQMLFDEYLFFLIESHADISEEIYDTTQDKQYIQKTGSLSSPSYMQTFRSRNSSSSSSGRGSLSPVNMKMDSNAFTYSGAVPNYSRQQHTSHNQFVFPYDEPNGYQQSSIQPTMKFPTNFAENILPQNNYSQNFNQSNQLPNTAYNQADQSEGYYSDDLEIVRQLQERTKSLMDASKYDHASSQQHRYHPYSAHTTDYHHDNNVLQYVGNDAYAHV